ncbi:MAG: HNH endonuclease, partial [Oscillospiraceae bacterium]|nr:HNH endonuclease [Oscillospiraceae bacterium]
PFLPRQYKFRCGTNASGFKRTLKHAEFNKESKNKNNYNDYTFKYESLKLFFAGKNYQNSKGKTLLTEKQYKKYEIEICEESLLEPTIKMNFICQISYTSPQGQNHYSQKWQVNMYSIFSKIENIKEKEKSISYQRSLMTKSKRYDILKRDNFKCKFCGRKADDGVELEVDHIIPVSKGGKTTDSNLQTLCYDCNQGKKAKM